MHARAKKNLGIKMFISWQLDVPLFVLLCCFIPRPPHPHQKGFLPRREKTDRLSAQGAERPPCDKEGGATSRSEEDKNGEIIHVQCERAGGVGRKTRRGGGGEK